MPIDHLDGTQGGQYRPGSTGTNLPAFPLYIGEVMDVSDAEVLHRVLVYIPDLGGRQKDVDQADIEDKRNWIGCQIISPLLASTSKTDNIAGDAYLHTQKSYGLFLPIPDINVTVVVGFPSGNIEQGVILGTIPDANRTFTIPGIPFTETVAGDAPGAERNWKNQDSDETKRPMHDPHFGPEVFPPPVYEPPGFLIKQGLDLDGLRGTTTSGVHRAYPYPTKAYGILTPAQHSFVMDDGYSDPPSGTKKQWWNPRPGFSGDSDCLVRLRTAGGAQVLLHDTEKLIYLITPDGETWIEMSDEEGKIDIYGKGDISIHSEGSINMQSGDRISIEAENEIDIKSLKAGGIKIEALAGSIELAAAENYNVTADGNGNILIAGSYKETAQRIDMNGPKAAKAAVPEIFPLACNVTVKASICDRVPEHEPWLCHTNLADPVKVYPFGGLKRSSVNIAPEIAKDKAS